MSRSNPVCRVASTIFFGVLLPLFAWGAAAMVCRAQDDDSIPERFQRTVRPFLEKYCLDCHGAETQEAALNLNGYSSADSVIRDVAHWEIILQRLADGEMPPEDAPAQPAGDARQGVVEWIREMRRGEALRNAGDPGIVLARRLSNAEYDYTIHDLTGADIRPTREFPIDPANEAGFANSGESLAMSPALLKKYLGAARLVADHLVLTPTGLDFAPHPVVVESDRDKYCVQRIIDFYQRQPVDYADYFFAAWSYQHREALGHADMTLEDCAQAAGISPKYLAIVWEVLTDGHDDAASLARLRAAWTELPAPEEASPEHVRQGCVRLRDLVKRERAKLIPSIDQTAIAGLNRSLQPAILWINHQMAANRRRGVLMSDDNQEAADHNAATARFCSVFPDAFFISERGRVFLDPKEQNKGRFLSAGFHLMVGYFRDDQPLYDLVLDQEGRRELDALWRELNFVTRAPMRQFRDFIYFERAESTRYLTEPEFDFARGEDDDITSPEKMGRVARLFVAMAQRQGVKPSALEILDEYFQSIDAQVRRVEKDLASAEPRWLESLVAFAQRAWRRPLSEEQRNELLQFYVSLRDDEQLRPEEAMRDVVASILMSPRFSYRIDPPSAGRDALPLDDYALASRLSYFLWSSMPDQHLLDCAASGDLHRPDVLLAQTRRMLKDPRAGRLAVEFGGNWLDFHQFQQHNAVDRQRFETFTDELRQAMFQEPLKFFEDLVRRDGSVLEFLEANHTFVNPVLAKHYGITAPHLPAEQWIRVDDAARYGRGGLLPMAVFLTKNSPGLRTSPVKRGYWVVRRLLGQSIPAPPANVPELPKDEANLGELSLRQVLARHRESKSCAACHQRFDSIGLVFEGYGPIGERRDVDLGGRAIDDHAEFPDGSLGQGVDGLRRYLQAERRDDFVDHLCRQLLAYGLGRTLQLSDELTLEQMRADLPRNDYRFSTLVESIVSSPQFLTRRGAEGEASR